MTASVAPPRSGSVPVADKILSTLDRFLHIEALSGIVLLIATAAALIGRIRPRRICTGPLLLPHRIVDKSNEV